MNMDNKLLNRCGAEVRRLRRAKNMGIVDLQAELRLYGWIIDRTGLGRLENGKRRVTDIELAILATVLNVSLRALLGNTQE